MGFRDDIVSSSKTHSSRVVLALDVGGPVGTRLERAKRLLNELGDDLAGVKVHWHLLLPFGLRGIAPVLDVCKDKQLPVIADLKLNDIASTNNEVVDLLYDAGFSAVIANPFVGAEEGLGPVIASSRSRGKGVILLVYMSHAGAKEGYGLKVGGKPLYLEFARRVVEWGADGAIVSAKEESILREVRKVVGRKRLILSPGVGVQGGDAAKAVAAGTDLAIVGRSIVDAKSPREALDAFNRSLPAW